MAVPPDSSKFPPEAPPSITPPVARNSSATIAVFSGPPRSARTRALFVVAAGADVGKVISFPATPGFTLGRSEECNLRFDDSSLSRTHARMMKMGNEYVFQDAGSTNGSYVNDNPAQNPVQLRDGDRVQLGSGTMLRFQLVDETEEQALHNRYEAAMRDGLTGVFNRKALDERLDSEVAFAARHGTVLSLVIVDVDHFKKVNDTYGHQGGDAVLKEVATVLQHGLRIEDFLGRYGGEEFCIIARGIESSGAVLMTERLRAAVAQSTIAFEGQPIRVTFSAGVADMTDCGGRKDKVTLLGIADGRLYKAKNAGRNRVVGS